MHTGQDPGPRLGVTSLAHGVIPRRSRCCEKRENPRSLRPQLYFPITFSRSLFTYSSAYPYQQLKD